jgi:hypothetical protein
VDVVLRQVLEVARLAAAEGLVLNRAHVVEYTARCQHEHLNKTNLLLRQGKGVEGSIAL